MAAEVRPPATPDKCRLGPQFEIDAKSSARTANEKTTSEPQVQVRQSLREPSAAARPRLAVEQRLHLLGRL